MAAMSKPRRHCGRRHRHNLGDLVDEQGGSDVAIECLRKAV
jgi:hypothetical protein